MNPEERRYIAAGAPAYYVRHIESQADVHHVAPRLEALAALHAALTCLYRDLVASGEQRLLGALLHDVSVLVTSAPPASEKGLAP